MFRWIEMVGSGERKKEKQLRAEGNNPALSSDGYSSISRSSGLKCKVTSVQVPKLWWVTGTGCSVGSAFPKSKHLGGTDYSRSTKRPMKMTSQHKTHGAEVLSEVYVKGKERLGEKFWASPTVNILLQNKWNLDWSPWRKSYMTNLDTVLKRETPLC